MTQTAVSTKTTDSPALNRAGTDEERAAVLTVLSAKKVSNEVVKRFVDVFGSVTAALTADDTTLENVGGLTHVQIRTIREQQGEGFGELELERALRIGARVLLPCEEEYPAGLLKISGYPAALYVLGNKLPPSNRCIAVVGSRNATEAGTEIAHQIGAGLAKVGVASVSGLALGIDGATHRGSLQEGGPTVGVIGCGVDVIYPRKHADLYEKVIRDGSLVSEFFLGTASASKNFPIRNRIISGMSMGTVVVEAAAKSGSLITAAMALQQNRLVFAVPGHPISKRHEGSNYLLRLGAILVRHAGDLLEDLAPQMGFDLPGQQMELLADDGREGLEGDELRVYDVLDPLDAIHVDVLSEKLEIDTSRMGALLLMMEMKQLVKRLPGERYIRNVRKS